MTGLAVPRHAGGRSAAVLSRFAGPAHSPVFWALLWIALVACSCAALVPTVFFDDDVDGFRTAFRLVGAAFAACGLIAWRRRPDSRTGLLMTVTGFLLFVEPLLIGLGNPELETVGDALEDTWSIFIIALLLTFLSAGRLETRADKILVGLFVFELGLEIGRQLFVDREGNFLLVSASGSTVDAFESAIGLVVMVGCLGTAGVIAVRWRRASGPRRRAMLPAVAGIASLIFFAAAQSVDLDLVRWLAVLSLVAVPAGFLAAQLRSRLARGSLADMLSELRALRGAELQSALAHAIGDPGLLVAYSTTGGWADAAGTPVDLDAVAAERRVVPVQADGSEIAAIAYDPSLDEDPELVEAVCAAASIALENDHLQRVSGQRMDELRASRERLVTAGDAERRRLERNLHDGAQQRLVAIAMQLRLLQGEIHADPSAAERLATTASAELALSLEELRDLARGIHPAVLDHGLAAALESLAAHATIPTSVIYAAPGELSEQVELAAYFVASEALANVAKHARAQRATVRVTRPDDTTLEVEVSDDGVGGAALDGGSGLRGLTDRVEALGGRLTVLSPSGEGTCVTAELPCGS